jgi:hypothetical protein
MNNRNLIYYSYKRKFNLYGVNCSGKCKLLETKYISDDLCKQLHK